MTPQGQQQQAPLQQQYVTTNRPPGGPIFATAPLPAQQQKPMMLQSQFIQQPQPTPQVLFDGHQQSVLFQQQQQQQFMHQQNGMFGPQSLFVPAPATAPSGGQQQQSRPPLYLQQQPQGLLPAPNGATMPMMHFPQQQQPAHSQGLVFNGIPNQNHNGSVFSQPVFQQLPTTTGFNGSILPPPQHQVQQQLQGPTNHAVAMTQQQHQALLQYLSDTQHQQQQTSTGAPPLAPQQLQLMLHNGAAVPNFFPVAQVPQQSVAPQQQQHSHAVPATTPFVFQQMQNYQQQQQHQQLPAAPSFVLA